MNRVVLNASFCLVFALLFSSKPMLNFIGHLATNSASEASHELIDSAFPGSSFTVPKHLQEEQLLLDTTLMITLCTGDSIFFNEVFIKTAGQYFDTLMDVNAQDSIITLNLAFSDSLFTNIDETLCEGDTLMVNGHVITTDTVIVENLTASAGCDSIVTITAVQNKVSFTEIDTTICPGDSVFFAGSFYTKDTALNLFTNSMGCDSVVLLKIIERDSIITEIQESICSGETTSFNNQTFGSDTTALFSFTAANGCDSTVVYNLTVQDTFLTNVVENICDGDILDFQGQQFTSDTVAVFSLSSVTGCDSTVVLNVNVADTITSLITREICAGQTAIFRNNFFTEDTIAIFNLTSINGCDSTIIYELTVRDTFFTEVSETICANESIQLGSQTFSTDTIHVETFQSMNGCDSTVRYTLSILDTIVENLNLSICAGDSIDLGGETFGQDTVHQVTFTAQNGCDSVVIYNLNVKDSIITNIDTAICAGSVIMLGTQMIDTSGIFNETFTAVDGCDSLVTFNVSLLDTFLTNIEESFCIGDTIMVSNYEIFSDTIITDTFTALNGCDSIVVIEGRALAPSVLTITERLCLGDSLQFNGEFLSNDTTVSITTTSSAGCDSTTILTLNMLDTFNNRIDTTICAGEFFIVGDSAYTETALIVNQFVTSTSCVTVTVNLTVADTFNINIDSTICQGDTVFLGSTPLTTSGTFMENFTTAQGCDSMVTVNLTVLDAPLMSMDSTICGGDTVIFAMDTLTETGIYQQRFPLDNGCDSVIELNLTVLPAPDIVIDTAICVGDSITIAGLTLDSTGTYTQMFQTINGCDSSITVNLSVLDTFRTIIDTSLCAGDTLAIGGLTIRTGGTFMENLQSRSGCDSIVVINVTELDTFLINLDVPLCFGDSLVLTDTTVTMPGVYTDFLTSSQGCDSTVVYNVSVLDTSITRIDTTICDGDSVIIGTDTLLESGIFDVVLQGTNGCDSTVVVTMNVLESFLQEDFFTICQGDTLMYRDTMFTESGTFTEMFTASNGCDSIYTVTVEVAEIKNEITDSTICQGDTVRFGMRDLTTSGRFTEIFTAANGCDSVVTINLTVLPSYDINIDTVICTGDTIFLGDQAITTDGFYSRMLQTTEGCDSLVSLNLMVIEAFFTSQDATICAGDTFLLGNQELTESGVYTQAFPTDSGCDSVIEVNLTVLEAFASNLDITLCEGETFTLGTQVITEAGDYADTLQTINGCDSIVTVAVEVLASFRDTFDVQICDNEVFIFDNRFLSQPGTYQGNFTAVNGCDSLVTINLTTTPVISARDEVTICDGEVYTFGTRQLTRAGEYTETFTASTGCDSVVFLTLNLRPKAASGFNATICETETYDFNGEMLTEAGIYQQTFTAANGCDSVVTLNLRVNPISRTDLTQTICDGDTYVFGERTVTEPGIYRDTFLAQNGCFIVLTLDLVVLPADRDTISAVICEGEVFRFGNQNITQSGIYSERLTSINGCDSTVVLQLEAAETFEDTLDVTICAGDTFNLGPQALTSSGTYIAFLQTIGGCDSTVVLNLATQNTIETNLELTLCNAASFEFGDQVLTQPGTYVNTFSTENGCDSTVTLELDFQILDTAITVDFITNEVLINVPDATFTWIDCETDTVVLETDSGNFRAPMSGNYRVIINSEGCMDTTDCFMIDRFVTSTREIDLSDGFNLYPNPTTSSITLGTLNGEYSGMYNLTITDMRGKVYRNSVIDLRPQQEILVNDLPAGLYLVNLFNRDKGMARLKFMKIE